MRVVVDFEKNDFRVFAQKLVVQRALNPNTEIAWRDAQAENPGLKPRHCPSALSTSSSTGLPSTVTRGAIQ